MRRRAVFPKALPALLGGALLAGGLTALSAVTERPAKGLRPTDAIGRLRDMVPDSSRTKVLVLATFHLRQIKETFKPGMLDGLIDRLAVFRPDAICIESLPGPRVRELELRKEAGPLYADLLDSFAKRQRELGRLALVSTGGTPEAASIKVQGLVARTDPPGAGTRPAADRAALALWMAAAYDPCSAALQWSYLTPEQRRDQRAAPRDLGERLDAECAEVNEDFALAARLARRLGLERLDPVDDFEDLEAYAAITPPMEKELQSHPLLAAVSKSAVYAESEALLKDCLARGDLGPVYALLNSARYGAADVEAQWGVFLRTRMASGADRIRLGLWENRNLKIAARIRAVAALHPGGRVLVVYGAAHKPFLEDELSRMADIELERSDVLTAK